MQKTLHSGEMGQYCLNLVNALLHDIHLASAGQYTEQDWFADKELICLLVSTTGLDLFTKVLPSSGKALDRALQGDVSLDLHTLVYRFSGLPTVGNKNRQLREGMVTVPMPTLVGDIFDLVLFGGLLRCVFAPDGRLAGSCSVQCVRALRQLLFVFYKLDLPYDKALQNETLDKFVKAEEDVYQDAQFLSDVINSCVARHSSIWAGDCINDHWFKETMTLLRARALLHELFRGYDVSDICPRHGPGSVSTGERNWEKYAFKRINPRAQLVFPFDRYYTVNGNHVAESYREWESILEIESPAKVVLVPKDSRGPRIIS